MKNLRLGKKAETSSGVAHQRPNLLWRFVRKTKKLFKSQPPPTFPSTSASSPSALRLRELASQSSSSVHPDPVLDSAEWLNGGFHPIHTLAGHQETTLPQAHSELLDAPTPADRASSIYSQLSVEHVDLNLRPLEAATSQGLLSEQTSLPSSQAKVELCFRDIGNVDGREADSFEEISQQNVLDMVRRALSNANLRLPPLVDLTSANLDLSKSVDAMSSSSSNSTELSGSAVKSSTPLAATAKRPEEDPPIEDYHTGNEKIEKAIFHTRGLHSLDLANISFYTAPGIESRDDQDTVLMSSLTYSLEDLSDILSALFASETEDPLSTEGNDMLVPAKIGPRTDSRYSYRAQPMQEVEMIRRQRLVFAARLETELSLQKEAEEAEFEKCYDTSDRLHEIDLLNLKEDHEAEIQDMQEERDAALSEVQTLTAKKETLERDVQILDALILSLKKVLEERCEEAESFRCQAKEFWQENNALLCENLAHRAATEDQNARGQEKAQLLAEVNHLRAGKDALQLQYADLVRRNDDVFNAYEVMQKESESVRRQLEAVVEEKAKDYSWHIQENKCHLALKSEDPRQAEANATAMARELYRRETAKVLSLRNELTDLCLTTDAQLRQQAQAIDKLSEEVRINAAALDTSFHENEELAERYQALLTAVKSNERISEVGRGLAGDLQTASKERALFGQAFLKAEIEVMKSERYRRNQVCDLRDLIEEKNEDLVKLKEQLHEVKDKVSAQEFLLWVKDDEINKTVPALKYRILEVEQMVELQGMSSGQYYKQVVVDLKFRLERQTQIAKWYEHEFVKALNQMEGLKTEWDFYSGGVARDLELVRNFRDERDVLQIECLAMRERFADELLREPLTVPETLKTNKRIEDEQLAHPDERVVKQFVDTYKAIPKWIVEGGCPGYEELRAEHMEGRFDSEREEVKKSFFVEAQNAEGDDIASLSEQEKDSFF